MARETIRHHKRNKKTKNEEPNGIIIPDSSNGLLTIVSDKPKRKYVRKNKNDNEPDNTNN